MTLHLPPQPLPDLMRRLSTHLDRLADDVVMIEEVVGSTAGEATGERAAQITRLQRLDYLRQSLEDLALLTHFIGQSCTGQAPVAAASKLKLAVTRDLLFAGQKAPDSTLSSGDVDLF